MISDGGLLSNCLTICLSLSFPWYDLYRLTIAHMFNLLTSKTLILMCLAVGQGMTTASLSMTFLRLSYVTFIGCTSERASSRAMSTSTPQIASHSRLSTSALEPVLMSSW